MITASVKRRQPGGDILDRIEKALEGPKTVKVGFPAGKSEEDMVLQAAANEFGATIPVTNKMRGWFWRQGSHVAKSTITIPERPFMRNALQENKAAYRALMRNDAKRIMRGQMGLRGALNRLGSKGRDDIVSSMTNGDFAPNAPFTVEKKGSSNTLRDSGGMAQAVTFLVED